MKKAMIQVLAVLACVPLTMGGFQTQSVFGAQKPKPVTIPGEDYDKDGGADAAQEKGDNPNSRFYGNPDFYNMKSGGTLTIIPNYKTMQQTTEYTCGPVSALMALEHFGLRGELTEWDIAIATDTSVDHDTQGALPGSADDYGEIGCYVNELYDFFDSLDGVKIVESSYKPSSGEKILTKMGEVADNEAGNLPKTFSAMSLYTSDNKDDSENYVDDAKDSYFVKWLTGHLNAGRPILVEWCDWNGHWQSIIGYDNNGTPQINDDMLIFADPYDTSDQWQDGYYYYPLERWFTMWKDLSTTPKPYQLQSYIIIDKAEK